MATLQQIEDEISKVCDVIIDARAANDLATECIARGALEQLNLDRALLIPQSRAAAPHS